ncbi:hypothetical protein KJ991_00485 [Patescibacteria group bacterium]|nr:hypothetical protein [Patescibacteria group bacterium]MBU4116004.1 hypothetical protein [Patescibacteria group bacterium]
MKKLFFVFSILLISTSLFSQEEGEKVLKNTTTEISWLRAQKLGPLQVFEEDGNLYVLVTAKSRDMQMATDKAAFEGRVILAKYLGEDILRFSLVVKRELVINQHDYVATVLVKVPKPE